MPDPSRSQVDKDVLQALLFRRADRMGRIKIDVKALAEELDRNYANMTLIIHQMVDEKRLWLMSGAKNRTKTFLVVEPGKWKESA